MIYKAKAGFLKTLIKLKISNEISQEKPESKHKKTMSKMKNMKSAKIMQTFKILLYCKQFYDVFKMDITTFYRK